MECFIFLGLSEPLDSRTVNTTTKDDDTEEQNRRQEEIWNRWTASQGRDLEQMDSKSVSLAVTEFVIE